MNAASVLSLTTIFKTAIETLAGGAADCMREVGKGQGHFFAAIGDGIGQRIAGHRPA